MATLVPSFGIIFGCGIVLLAIWTEYNRDRALIEISGDRYCLVVCTFVFHMGQVTDVPGFVFLSTELHC
jgi:hypothetical protein